MRIESQTQFQARNGHGYVNTAVQSFNEKKDSNKVTDKGADEAKDKLDLKSLKEKPDYAKTKLEKDEQEKLEKLALAGNSRLDKDQYDMVKRLEQIEREVVMHEKAHQATGGSSVGAVYYKYTMGPDYRHYATGGNVEYKLPYAGTPESMMRAFQGLKNAAMASDDASGQDKRMASMAVAKIRDIKTKIAKDKGQLAYYEEMVKNKQAKEKTKKLN